MCKTSRNAEVQRGAGPRVIRAWVDSGRYVGQVNANGNKVLVTYSDGTVEQAQVYESDVKTMIALLQPVMEQYIVTSRRFAVRMALQGGLSEYAAGAIRYDAARDVYVPTTERQLAPLFEKIFRDAPDGTAGHGAGGVTGTAEAVYDYLADWNEILWQVYPDYAPTGAGNLLGSAVGVDQAFIMQMLIPAFEAELDELDTTERFACNAANDNHLQRVSAAALAAANNNEQTGVWRGAAFTLEIAA